MIEINLGNIGSGKTASVVREMVINEADRQTFSNIITKKLKNNSVINKDMIVKKEIGVTPAGKPVEELKVNKEFWQKQQKLFTGIDIILDEAHELLNSRRGMTKFNVLMTSWLALLRRVIGGTEEGTGRLVLITQLERRLDVISREMCTRVKFHKCHYQKTCKKCNATYYENNETPDKINVCIKCGHNKLRKHSHVIEVLVFENMDKYDLWNHTKDKTYYDRYFIYDIEDYFGYYDTLQWDNLITD